MKTLKTILNESSVSRVLQHTKDRNIGAITAHRGEYDSAENARRNKKLETDIRSHGFGFVHVKGRYIENHGTPDATAVDEHSYLIVGSKGDDGGKLKGFLKKHGEKYEQDSVLHKAHDDTEAHLIGTKEGGYPGKGNTETVGRFHPTTMTQFHSVLRKNRGFEFRKEDVDYIEFKFYTPVGGMLNRSEVEMVGID